MFLWYVCAVCFRHCPRCHQLCWRPVEAVAETSLTVLCACFLFSFVVVQTRAIAVAQNGDAALGLYFILFVGPYFQSHVWHTFHAKQLHGDPPTRKVVQLFACCLHDAYSQLYCVCVCVVLCCCFFVGDALSQARGQHPCSGQARCVCVCCVVLCCVVLCCVVLCCVVLCCVVLCCVVWCGVVWCGVVWCGVVWCGVVRCGVPCCGVLWCVVLWCVVSWCVVVCCVVLCCVVLCCVVLCCVVL